jgi:hypothetical protein
MQKSSKMKFFGRRLGGSSQRLCNLRIIPAKQTAFIAHFKLKNHLFLQKGSEKHTPMMRIFQSQIISYLASIKVQQNK